MRKSNLHRSSSDIYREAESLIYEATNIPIGDTNSKLALYLKAVSLLDQIQMSEKKEYFRNIYKQRMDEINQQIKNIHLILGHTLTNADETRRTSQDSIKITPTLDTNSPNNSQVMDLQNCLPLYPTLPDINFDVNSQNQNSDAPIINPTIISSDNFINQVQTQTYIPYQTIPQSQMSPKYQTQDFPSTNQIPANNDAYLSPNVYYPPFLTPVNLDLNDNFTIPDSPASIPTIKPNISYDSYKPLSQPEPFSNINDNQIHDSSPDSSDKKKKKKSDTEILKGNFMLFGKDHFESDSENNQKNTASLTIGFNDKKDPKDSLVGPEYKIKKLKHKKKHHHKKKPEPKVSDKVINIPENFKIESLIGNSTLGALYLATEYSSKKKFVIRELEDFKENNETSVSFFRDIEALCKAKHPAVLHLYGFSLRISKEKQYPAIVTEYLPGGTLLDIINGKKKVTMTEKLILLYGICEAMHYLHDKLKIVHRDLKPKNIMLNSNNEPKISDFGLSKVMSEKYMMRSHNAISPKYTAPELLRDEEYSNKVDVYSYGIIAYELLTGKMAYNEAKNNKELKTMVLSGKRPSLDDENNLHQIFKDLIQNCWNENEASRPTFYDLALRFRKMEFVADNCDKTVFRKYANKFIRRK